MERFDAASHFSSRHEISSRNCILADLLNSSLQQYEIIYERDPNFYVLEPEHTESQDLAASDNSLFISVSRSLIYNIKFQGLRSQLLSSESEDHFCDLYLQEILRRKLCLYWLEILATENAELRIKYSRLEDLVNKFIYLSEIENNYEFLYYIYQMSIANFSQNKLTSHILQDLATSINLKIVVIETHSDSNMHLPNESTIYRTYTPLKHNKSNDQLGKIYLSYNSNCRINYKPLILNHSHNNIKLVKADLLLQHKSLCRSDKFISSFKMNTLGYHEISAKLIQTSSCSYLKLFFFFINLIPVDLIVSRSLEEKIDFRHLNALNNPGEFVSYLNILKNEIDLAESFKCNLKL